MSNKEAFIKLIDELLNDVPDFFGESEEGKKAFAFFEEMKSSKGGNGKAITENGAKIISFMRDNEEKHKNLFSAKVVGEGLFISGRAVAGSMRKLVSDGYVEKIGKDPTMYALTQSGRDLDLTI